MKGMELAEEYYSSVCAPAIRSAFPAECDRIAAGLVGDGSEAFGYDDELSQDHDFTPQCCFWLLEEDAALAPRLEAVLRSLPRSHRGYPVRDEGMREEKRRGVWEIGAFYRRFIGVPSVPETVMQWLRPPETSFAQATNGKVFFDGAGAFSAVREQLLDYYPEDIRLLILAGQCMHMAQSGQYNYPRCAKRGETVAAALAEREFIQRAMHAVYALNRRYMPYYKWTHRGMRDLKILGSELSEAVLQLVRLPTGQTEQKSAWIEQICISILAELRAQGLTDGSGDFLLPHSDSIRSRIKSDGVRSISPFLI